ncbi:WXG100 family type VII secretion target [Streptomyces tubbatahanensis]|uniref:WXG100 family type VII secretion target n=1 Tax=Streptomyces tubbatahanensis TaxID=2923272 RepID=A0ABY3XXS2_9ACTN|nr:WXG100 family type VII secretion target [Streptomyces tubbatahanensis]UNS99331.1 WXG100 family type VII secretion target [Streptomyces tubbatahanensis]
MARRQDREHQWSGPGLQGVIDAIEGQWEGIGAHAFDVKQNEINNRMKQLNRLLAYFLEGIEAARKLSGGNEDDIAQALRGVDVVDSGYGVNPDGQPASKLDMYSPPAPR